MELALAEAAKALGRTSPNPAVGAVVVQGGKVVARGHTQRAGGAHAEVMALGAAGKRARGAELFVTLEPCNHLGRTGPCTEAVLAAGVARVVVGMRDPNPNVRGGGGKRLARAGVQVVNGVLRERCEASNERWSKFIRTGVPWVVLKAAVTLDGKLATAGGDSKWVSGEAARALVHEWRGQLDAVLVGVGTARADDPLLTARRPGARDPVRVIVDSALRLPASAKVLPALVACLPSAPARRARALERAGAELLRCEESEGRVALVDLLGKLGARGVVSILVEGGAAIHGAFLAAGLWDELRLFLAPRILGEPAKSWAALGAARSMGEALRVDGLTAEQVGDDVLLSGRKGKKQG